MSLRVLIGLACSLSGFAAQTSTPVAEIINLTRAAIAKHDADAGLAKVLHKLKPADQIDDRAIEELESEGAGPKAVAELERLRDASRALPPPAVPPFPRGVAPSRDEQRRIVNAAQELALNYAASLPDFICTEVVRRYDDARGGWELKDTLEVKLTYFDQKENYRLLTVNGRASVRAFESVGGAVSEGEFGSMLYSIFVGGSKTEFHWDHDTNLRKRPARVFAFRIRAENSSYKLQFRSSPQFAASLTVAGQHGFVYLDRETNQILRIAAEADTIPHSFPLRQSSTLLDYDFTAVGGRPFLLPLRAEVRMGTDRLHTRNLVDFHGYRKFTGESTITFQ